MAWISNKELDLAQCVLRDDSRELIPSSKAAKVGVPTDNSQDAPLLVRIAAAEKIVYSDPQQLADAVRIGFYAVGSDSKRPFLDEYERNAAKKALQKLVVLTKEFPHGEEAYRILQPLLEPWLRPPTPRMAEGHHAAFIAVLTEAGYFTPPEIEPHRPDEAFTPAQEDLRREVQWDLAAQFPKPRLELAEMRRSRLILDAGLPSGREGVDASSNR